MIHTLPSRKLRHGPRLSALPQSILVSHTMHFVLRAVCRQFRRTKVLPGGSKIMRQNLLLSRIKTFELDRVLFSTFVWAVRFWEPSLRTLAWLNSRIPSSNKCIKPACPSALVDMMNRVFYIHRHSLPPVQILPMSAAPSIWDSIFL